MMLNREFVGFRQINAPEPHGKNSSIDVGAVFTMMFLHTSTLLGVRTHAFASYIHLILMDIHTLFGCR